MLLPTSRLRDRTHDHPDGPGFAGQYAQESPQPANTLTVATYNINFGLSVSLAIEAFETFEPLQRAGIILLQEMDEHGTERMARALNCNFVYYPASISRLHGRNFGNAILARWPLVDSRKLILPHRHPVRDQIRIAVRATVLAGDLQIASYSVHTETYTVPAAYRRAQVAALVDAIPPGNGPVIVGGDFNTVSRRSINRIVDQFAVAGLARTSAGAGPTVARLGIKATAADHIFTRGLAKLARGKVVKARASDHFPLWVDLAWPGSAQRRE